jgi:uncharacterized protein
MKEFFKGFIPKRNVVAKDNWVNYTTGYGTPDSRVNSTKFSTPYAIPASTLSAMYRGDGMARRIVNLMVDDAMRGFIEADTLLLDELDRLSFKQVLTDCACFARLYGGAAIVAFSVDGTDLEHPINLKGLKKVVKLNVFDRHSITWLEEDIERDYLSESYGEPAIYTIQPPVGERFRVHRSRCHFIGGAITTADIKRKNNSWDDSILQAVYNALLNYGAVQNSSAEIVQDYVQKVLYMDNIMNQVASSGTGGLVDRLITTQKTLSNVNFLAVDSQYEKYEKHVSSVGGLADLWDRFAETITANSGYPISKLFGKQSTGLSNNSHNDLVNYYDDVNAYRHDNLTPAIDWIINILQFQAMWKTKPEYYVWEFPSLVTPTEKENAEIKHILAQTDSIYVSMGAVDARELFEQRHANGTFHYDINIEDFKETDELDVEGNEDLLDTVPVEDTEEEKLLKSIASKI